MSGRVIGCRVWLSRPGTSSGSATVAPHRGVICVNSRIWMNCAQRHVVCVSSSMLFHCRPSVSYLINVMINSILHGVNTDTLYKYV